jgi:hypothetical protein
MREGTRECPLDGEDEAFGEGEGDSEEGGLEEDDAPGGRGESRRLGQEGIVSLW